ncbi:MAG: hypothetical protein AAF602_14910, partial [Myxococcota bacterium]
MYPRTIPRFASAALAIALLASGCPSDTPRPRPDAPETGNPPEDTAPLDTGALPGPPDPLDPVRRAPSLDPTTTASFDETVDFLWTDDDPIQRDVEPGALEDVAITVLRGHIRERSGAAVSGVRVALVEQTPFGWTETRRDGGFELAVPAGRSFRIAFTHPDYLPAQRSVTGRPRDFQPLGDIALVPLSTRALPVTFDHADPQVLEGPAEADASGERQPIVVVPPFTSASLIQPDGTEQPVSQLTLRATEYTVGDDGPAAMPASLPPESAYTYAVELSADEATASGAAEVRFSQPIGVALANFLDYPTGLAVPTGAYDAARGAWVASDDGVIAEVIAIEDGLAVLDVRGDGTAAAAEELDTLGLGEGERSAIASRFAVGESLWWTRLPHLTPWDFNWGFGFPSDATDPDADADTEGADPERPNCMDGSILECESRSLGMRIPLNGAHGALDYRSRRAPGYEARRSVDVRLTGGTVPESLRRIVVRVTVAGQTLERSYAAPFEPEQRDRIVWDGHDAYGRPVQGRRRAIVDVYYNYPGIPWGVTFGSVSASRTFGRSGGRGSVSVVSGSMVQRDIELAKRFAVTLDAAPPDAAGLSRFTHTDHHALDVASASVERGDGRRLELQPGVVGVLAGGGTRDPGSIQPGETLDALTARLLVSAMASAPDGSLYLAQASRVYHVLLDGTIEPVGGHVSPAIVDLTVDAGGTLYAATTTTLHQLVGGAFQQVGGRSFDCVDPVAAGQVPATDACLYVIRAIDAAPDGTVYLGISYTSRPGQGAADGRLYALRTDGWIEHVAGGDTDASQPPSDGLAMDARFGRVVDVAVGPDGEPIVLSSAGTASYLSRIRPDASLRVIAGQGAETCANWCAVTAPPTSADSQYMDISAITTTPDGRLYFVMTLGGFHPGVYALETDGQIRRVAGDGTAGPLPPDGTPLLSGPLPFPNVSDVEVRPDGGIYLSTVYEVVEATDVLIAVTDPESGAPVFVVADPEQDERYVFDEHGRHLRTERLPGLEPVRRFEYADGRLRAMVDVDGLRTEIERSPSGFATAIVGPYGHRTQLVHRDGELAQVIAPGGGMHEVDWATGGLLSRFEDPTGAVNTFDYDARGFLTRDTHTSGESWVLRGSRDGATYLTELETIEGYVHHFELAQGADRLTEHTRADPTEVAWYRAESPEVQTLE